MNRRNLQKWETCKYGVAADGKDEMAYELKAHGLNELYNCENEAVIQSGKHNLRDIGIGDAANTKMAVLTELAISGALSKKEAERLLNIVNRRLTICRHCALYQNIDEK
jgi:hypothetical protein